MSALNSSELMKQKFILLLNGALTMENAGKERLQTRISETIIPETKQHLQHHLEESQGHIERLNQLITTLCGQPHQGKIGITIAWISSRYVTNDE